MNLRTKVATHFSYGTGINDLHKICETTDSPNIKPKVDNNGTRVTAQHRLLESLLCLNKSLRIYQVRNRGLIGDADANWQQFGEFEAVLNITQVMTTMAQYEESAMSHPMVML
jgi:hypothetical protein